MIVYTVFLMLFSHVYTGGHITITMTPSYQTKALCEAKAAEVRENMKSDDNIKGLKELDVTKVLVKCHEVRRL